VARFSEDISASCSSSARLNRAPAVFDYKKLDWFNGQYIRRLSARRLRELLEPFLQKDGLVSTPPEEPEIRILEGLPALVRERLTVLSDVTALAAFLFREPPVPSPEELVPKRLDRGKTVEILRRSLEQLEGFDARGNQETEESFRSLAEGLEVKLGDLLMPLRVAVTGSRVSPPLFESMRLLGESKVRERVRRALAVLSE